MRDFIAAIVALLLLFVAASLATTLHFHRRRRRQVRKAEQARGRTIVAELPTSDELTLFSEDPRQFHYGALSIDKDRIVAVRVLINGSPIATVESARHSADAKRHPTFFDDRQEGIARDRWDVAIETDAGAVLVECGAIRERVSQELARAIFEAVKQDVEQRNTST